jgi:cytochrome c oxidase assembly protein subunit 15
MQSLKRLSLAALILAFAQIVFGGIVRITGSGMGCGDHWPKCLGEWFPPHDRVDLIIEITHRYLALGLSLVIVWLLVSAWLSRGEAGVGGSRGVLGPAAVAASLVVIAALLGAVTVRLLLNPLVVAAHKTIAIALLATLGLAYFRAGGFAKRESLVNGSTKTARSATIAVILALFTIILGALTANLPDAAASCTGFPHCREITASGAPFIAHIVHRILAFLLFGHLLGMAIAVGKRNEPAAVKTAARLAFGAAFVQVLIAAGMIEMGFPLVMRSMHQAVGTFVWLVIVVLGILATNAARTQRDGDPARVAA